MQLETEVLSLLKLHKYSIIVRKIHEDRLITSLPLNFLNQNGNHNPPSKLSFQLTRGRKTSIEITVDENSYGDPITVPDYVTRIALESQILDVSSYVGVPACLIEYHNLDGEAVSGLEELIGPPENEEDCEKEELLQQLVIDACLNGFTEEHDRQAVELGISEGFEICKTFIPQD